MKPKGKKGHWHEGVFGLLYETISWNLMCRTNTTAHIMLQHIEWGQDCMIIEITRSKSDQSGTGKGNTKHIYANAANPLVCTILAMAVYLWAVPRDTKQHLLFQGSSQDDRFTKLLHKVNACDDNSSLGLVKKRIGSHSNRKGPVTYCFQYESVSAIQVYLRAGWSIGAVQDRYIMCGAGGDENVGRVVALLDVHSEQFGLLPPHFKSTEIELLNKIGWNNIYKGYDICQIVSKLVFLIYWLHYVITING